MMSKNNAFYLAILVFMAGAWATNAYSDFIYLQIAIPLGLFIMITFAILRGDRKNQFKIRDLPLSKIVDADIGLVKLKGRLKGNLLLRSKLTNTKCIGHSYNAMKWKYTGGTGDREKSQFKIFDSTDECSDFYIYDETGRIRVLADGIFIMSDLNHHKKIEQRVTYTESLLLPDDNEYYMIGTVFKQGDELVMLKGEVGEEFAIASPNDYDIIFNTSRVYRLSCAAFLIGIIVAAIVGLNMILGNHS